MGFDIGRVWHKFVGAIDSAGNTLVKGLKDIANGLTGELRAVMDKVVALGDALATGNIEDIGKKFADLGNAVANFPGDISGTVVGSAVKMVGGMAAKVLGQQPPAWLNTVASAASIASHFTNPEEAAAWSLREGAAAALGQQTDTGTLIGGIKSETDHPNNAVESHEDSNKSVDTYTEVPPGHI